MIKSKKNNTLKIKRGDTFVHRFSLFIESAEGQAPLNLSDVAQIDLQAMSDDEIVLSLSTKDRTLILQDNSLIMLVSKKLTEGKEWETADYDVQVTFNDNVTKTIFSGKIKLEPDVTGSKVAENETSFERAIEFAMQNEVTDIVVTKESVNLIFGIAVKGDRGDDGQDGATFTPHLSESGDLSFSNNKGLKNPQAVNIKGQKGDTGITFTPKLSEDGVLSFTNDGQLDNPAPVNIRGRDGEDGIDGVDGNHGKSAYQEWVDLGNQGTVQDFINSLKGNKGEPGDDGKSAYQLWLEQGNHGELSDFLESLKGRNGNDGDKGDDGLDGATFTPIVSEAGELSWSNNKGLQNPPAVNIKGPTGDPANTENIELRIEQLLQKNQDLESRLARIEAKFGTGDRAVGRNYIINSEHYDHFKNNNSAIFELNTGKDGKGNWMSGTSKGKYQISTYGELLNSFQYFSEDLSNQVITTSAEVMSNYDCDVSLDDGAKMRIKANQWTRISVTGSGNRMPGLYVMNVDASVGSGQVFRLYHKKWKIEKGRKATEWVQA